MCMKETWEIHSPGEREGQRDNGCRVSEAVNLDLQWHLSLSQGKPWNKLICTNESQKGLGIRVPGPSERCIWIGLEDYLEVRGNNRAFPVWQVLPPSGSLLCVCVSECCLVLLSEFVWDFLPLSLSLIPLGLLRCWRLYFCIFAISTCLSMPPCLSFSVTLLSLQARPRNCPLRPQPHQAWSQWSGPHFTYPGPFLWPGLWVSQERCGIPRWFSFEETGRSPPPIATRWQSRTASALVLPLWVGTPSGTLDTGLDRTVLGLTWLKLLMGKVCLHNTQVP